MNCSERHCKILAVDSMTLCYKHVSKFSLELRVTQLMSIIDNLDHDVAQKLRGLAKTITANP